MIHYPQHARRLGTAALLAAASFLAVPLAAQAPDAQLVAKAKAINERVIKIDTHVDFNPGTMVGPAPNYATGITGNKVDLPKMENDGLDAVFFSIYVGQRPDLSDSGYARAFAGDIEKFRAVHQLAEKIAPDRIQIALTADDVRRIHAAGKKVALMGVENGYGIGTDITNVRRFYDEGARYLSLTHNGHNQLADSNTGEEDGVWKWNGLSPLGKQVVAEANRLGIMMDLSHPSKQSNLQVLALSKAPVIASHSAVRALGDASRDLDDETLLALKKNGGVVQIVAYTGFLRKPVPDSPERATALADLRASFGMPAAGGGGRGGAMQDPAQRARFQSAMADLNAKFPPPPRATVKDLVDHIDYAVKLIGIDHVGIGSDFDGGGGIDGYDNASETLNVTLELVRRGYTEEQIGKIWGGNLLRVMAEVERAAKRLQSQPS